MSNFALNPEVVERDLLNVIHEKFFAANTFTPRPPLTAQMSARFILSQWRYVAFSGGKDSVVLLDLVKHALPINDAYKKGNSRAGCLL